MDEKLPYCRIPEEIEPGFRQVVAIWWLLVWRGAVGAFVLAFVIGFVLGLAAAITHFTSIEGVKVYAQIAGGAIGLIWSLFVTLMALRKKYRGFRIALIQVD
ncbi:type III secretory pathway component EscS [Rhizomicrobium palustre]|uniref:Type III secretory pathway component EscS n=1 Tax=Rhizomicrobium palustre TaxID=189966 RepID=A0A846MVV1_9PROT|nr:hypothetical protein [Rhizomicrobium palustre]NIK87688.1 type III secretory pathway component EscS [Rhizomicrobium palustre]